MGMGKTLQSIALIHTMLNTKLASNNKLINRVLLLCPLSLRQNWSDEFEKWGLRNFCYVPSNLQELERYFATAQRTPVCILNYNIIFSYEDLLSTYKFDLLICDEGHCLKNDTRIRQMLTRIGSKRRLILTGTPVSSVLGGFDFIWITNEINSFRFKMILKNFIDLLLLWMINYLNLIKILLNKFMKR